MKASKQTAMQRIQVLEKTVVQLRMELNAIIRAIDRSNKQE